MPIYEYRCLACGQSTSIFLRHLENTAPPSCPNCGEAMARCLSTFSYHKSEAMRLAEAGAPDKPDPDYYKDPRNIGRWAEKRFKEMGMEMPKELQEKIAASRDGILPEPLKEF